MVADTIELGISLLRGGNVEVQKVTSTCTLIIGTFLGTRPRDRLFLLYRMMKKLEQKIIVQEN